MTGQACNAAGKSAWAPAVDQSGVWRYRELLPEPDEARIVTFQEGNTPLWEAPRCAAYAGMRRLTFKHLGMNPTG
ncbi:MAG: threonine synthase, partial [Blastocatellia bacterium]